MNKYFIGLLFVLFIALGVAGFFQAHADKAKEAIAHGEQTATAAGVATGVVPDGSIKIPADDQQLLRSTFEAAQKANNEAQEKTEEFKASVYQVSGRLRVDLKKFALQESADKQLIFAPVNLQK